MGVRVSGCGGRGSPQRFVSWERGGGFSLRVPVECARVLGHLRHLHRIGGFLQKRGNLRTSRGEKLLTQSSSTGSGCGVGSAGS